MKVVYRNIFGRRVVRQCDGWPELWKVVNQRLFINRVLDTVDAVHSFLNPAEP